ncbi:MAG TPA: hypothetical protein VK679_09495 [Gemmatimonadaceae bacterium]|jgi:hypothetical protein|nr:hypothetical protein [Gemmatimonadaceae bacterium]
MSTARRTAAFVGIAVALAVGQLVYGLDVPEWDAVSYGAFCIALVTWGIAIAAAVWPRAPRLPLGALTTVIIACPFFVIQWGRILRHDPVYAAFNFALVAAAIAGVCAAVRDRRNPTDRLGHWLCAAACGVTIGTYAFVRWRGHAPLGVTTPVAFASWAVLTACSVWRARPFAAKVTVFGVSFLVALPQVFFMYVLTMFRLVGGP